MAAKSFLLLALILSVVIDPSRFSPQNESNHATPNPPIIGRSIDTSQNEDNNSAAHNFDVQKLAEGVYAVVRKEPAGFMVDANNVFIINDDYVVVVDSNGAPSITKEVLAALRKLTSAPVKYVINTHWHDDHIRGNQVYRETFPGVEFIGHHTMREYLPAQGAINRKQFLEGAPQFLDILKSALAKNKSLTGAELSPEERISHTSDVRLAELVLSEGAAAQTILPTITVTDRLTLSRGDRVIDVMHLGAGHTAADIVVHLPKERILITGDLVVWPIPLVGDPQSHIGEWPATLEKLIALSPNTIVPGHGPVLHDVSYLKTLAAMFASISRQTRAAVSKGETLEQTRKSVNLEGFQKQLAGDSPVRRLLFSNYVFSPGVAAGFREASEK